MRNSGEMQDAIMVGESENFEHNVNERKWHEDRYNIRLYAGLGSCVIFNWEGNPKELRVNRPDGNDKAESGSLATAPVTPLAVNAWHTLRWRITEQGMEVWADGKSTFKETRKYNLSSQRPVTVFARDSTVDVASLVVKTVEINEK